MFFYLAKIFWFFAQPSGLLLVMMIAGAVLLRTGRTKSGRRLIAASVALLLVGGLLPLSNWLILPLEQRFPRADLTAGDVTGIVVLGGGEDARIWIERGVHSLNEAGERFTEAAGLARRYPKAKVVFTGGSIEILTRPTDRRRRGKGDPGRPRPSRRRTPRCWRPRRATPGRTPSSRKPWSAQAGRALAAGHVGLAHAALDGRLPQGGLSPSSRGRSTTAPRAPGMRCDRSRPLPTACGVSTRPCANGSASSATA